MTVEATLWRRNLTAEIRQSDFLRNERALYDFISQQKLLLHSKVNSPIMWL
ncbi:hypothetical protein FM107_14780 [Sphingobacterium sp. JB170]|nr:hypothetical protein FM107_14780 [Sphingobacterium sp. JB170]